MVIITTKKSEAAVNPNKLAFCKQLPELDRLSIVMKFAEENGNADKAGELGRILSERIITRIDSMPFPTTDRIYEAYHIVERICEKFGLVDIRRKTAIGLIALNKLAGDTRGVPEKYASLAIRPEEIEEAKIHIQALCSAKRASEKEPKPITITIRPAGQSDADFFREPIRKKLDAAMERMAGIRFDIHDHNVNQECFSRLAKEATQYGLPELAKESMSLWLRQTFAWLSTFPDQAHAKIESAGFIYDIAKKYGISEAEIRLQALEAFSRILYQDDRSVVRHVFHGMDSVGIDDYISPKWAANLAELAGLTREETEKAAMGSFVRCLSEGRYDTAGVAANFLGAADFVRAWSTINFLKGESVSTIEYIINGQRVVPFKDGIVEYTT